MSCRNRDLTLDEALSDPMIGAAMRADRVDPLHFETLLRATARRLDLDGGAARLSPAAVAARCRAALARRPSSGDLTAW